MNTIREKKENFGLALLLSVVITLLAAFLILLINQDSFKINLFSKEEFVDEYSIQIEVIKNFTAAKNIPDKIEYISPSSKASKKLRSTMPVPIGADKVINQSIQPLIDTSEKNDIKAITLRQEITYLYHFQGKDDKIERTTTYDLENIDDTWLIVDFISEIESYE